jgi:tetratricopeptide (TPR) repeat protein
MAELVRRSKQTLIAAAIAAGAGGLVACATTPQVPETEIQAYLADKPASLHAIYRKAIVEGPRHWVFNHLHAGLQAMELGEFEAGAESFDEALFGIETVYANSESADEARSLWREEGSKDFKGEPYERAMAYYYRGLLYLKEGDFENARASFRGGMFQDVAGENAEYEEDFALLSLLDGFASQCNGDFELAEESFRDASSHRPGFEWPSPSHNVIVVAETGRSPEKYGDGPGNSWLRFRQGGLTEDQAVRIRLDDALAAAFPFEDLYYQASTRGGRPIEVVLEGQAKFKDDMHLLGKGAQGVGAAVLAAGTIGDSSEAQLVGAGLFLGGLLIDAMSNAVKPNADTRAWQSLPGRVHAATFATTRAETPIQVEFLDAAGDPIPSLTQEGTVETNFGSCQVVWVRSGAAAGSAVARQPMGMRLAAAGL